MQEFVDMLECMWKTTLPESNERPCLSFMTKLVFFSSQHWGCSDEVEWRSTEE